MSEENASNEVHRVHLLGLPLHTRELFIQHTEGLVREMALIQLDVEHSAHTSLPPRLLEVATQVRHSYTSFQARPEAELEAARAEGKTYFDVTYDVPEQAVGLVRHLARVLEEADAFCRAQQHLLTLPASEEVAAYRRWIFGEFQRQVAGQAPRPWHLSPSGAPPVLELAQERGSDPDLSARGEQGEPVAKPLVLESMASGVAGARRYVREVLRQLGETELEDSAELGVSELVTNAMLHADTTFSVAVRATPAGRVRIEVTDASPLPLQLRHFGAAATTGRGLQLVASVSHNWGVQELPPAEAPGKTVWFEPREAAVEAAVEHWDLADLA